MTPFSAIVTRFAPSPTGPLHVGSARTALFNYLFARGQGGKFILRVEDTDKERSKKDFETDILGNLAWLGLGHDEFYRQSERGEVYREHLERLVKTGAAFVSSEAAGERQTVIRLRNRNDRVSFRDVIRGEVTFDTGELGDFIIAKSVTEPLFHFAVVLDDWLMGVSHVIRGEDHLSNTARQVLIQEALGASRPVYAHLPLILNPDRTKMSKRAGDTAVGEYRAAGYLPEALFNFLAFLGWSPQDKTNEEIFSLEALVGMFDLERVQKGGAVFNLEKLNWMNKQHLRRLPLEELAKKLLPFLPERVRSQAMAKRERWLRVAGLERERLEKLCDIGEHVSFFFEETLPPLAMLQAPKGSDLETAKTHLNEIARRLGQIKEGDWRVETLKETLMPYADLHGRGAILWPLRVALTAKEKSPDPFTVAYILGREETLARLKRVLTQ